MTNATNTPPPTPFFSVCLPTYNRGYVLAKAIRSVLAQDFRDFELLICDNASTDNTREVIESFDDPRIRAMYWAELVSMYGNHNRGLEHARAEWVVFLHSDDILLPDALSRMHTLIEAHSPDVVYGPLPFKPGVGTLAHDTPHLDFFFNHGLSPSGTAYRKSAVFAKTYFAEKDLIADHSLSVVWGLEGRKTVNGSEPFATRDLGENTTCSQLRYGQWNVVVYQCLAPHLASREIRKRIEADIPHRTPTEVKYAIRVMGLCGHPLTVLGICLRKKLLHVYGVNAFVKGILIRLLGLRGFTRLFYGKRGLKPLE